MLKIISIHPSHRYSARHQASTFNPSINLTLQEGEGLWAIAIPYIRKVTTSNLKTYLADAVTWYAVDCNLVLWEIWDLTSILPVMRIAKQDSAHDILLALWESGDSVVHYCSYLAR
jgi:hypothetical protein